jgi:hypothetical protein
LSGRSPDRVASSHALAHAPTSLRLRMAQPPLATLAAFPAHLELLRARFANASIAVVGSSGTLLYGEAVGAEIDSHDVVVRVNQAYTQGFEARIGSRTDVRVMYGGGMESLKRESAAGWLHTALPGERAGKTVLPGELLVYSWLAAGFPCDVADADGASCLRRHGFSEDVITSEQAEKMKAGAGVWHLHTEVPEPELPGDPRMSPSNHGSLWTTLRDWSHYRANPVAVLSHRWISNLHQAVLSGAASWPTTGFIALALALALRSSGKRVSVYGFGACRGCGKYYQCQTRDELTGYHSFEMEAKLRRRWADEALIHLHEPACEGVRYQAVARVNPSPPALPPVGVMAPCERLALWWHDPWRTRINDPTTPVMIWCSGWSNGWGKDECVLGYWWKRLGDAGSPPVFGACEWNEAEHKCTESNQTWDCDGLPPWPPPLPSPPHPLAPSPTPLPPPRFSLPIPLPPLPPSSSARRTWLSQWLSDTSARDPLLIRAAAAFGAVVLLAGVFTRICTRYRRAGYRSAVTLEEDGFVSSHHALSPCSLTEQLSLEQRPVHVSTEPSCELLGRLASPQSLVTLIEHPSLPEDPTESGTIEMAFASEIRATTFAAVQAAAAAAAAATVAAAREDGDGSETFDGVAGGESTVHTDLVQIPTVGGLRSDLEADAEESFIL